MKREQLEMLKEVMALEFTVIDLHLYLDTHPNDQRALMEHDAVCRELMMVKERYEQCYGPLTAQCASGCFPWQWIEEPWPWEICYQ